MSHMRSLRWHHRRPPWSSPRFAATAGTGIGSALNDLPNDTAELKAVQAREALLRKTIYVRVLRLVYVLTALLIPIVGLKLLFY